MTKTRFDSLNAAYHLAKIPAGMATTRQCLIFGYLVDRVLRRCTALTRDELLEHIETMPARLGV